MLRDLLAQKEPRVYEALRNALRNGRLAPALLFCGPARAPKEEAALLTAMALLCGSDDFPCEECDTCRRAAKGVYGDLLILDGSERTLVKDDIDAVIKQFSATALENEKGRRVYIVKKCENATPAAMSSLLKFLEEPSPGVTAILTADDIAKVMPTVISRCAVLPFIPPVGNFPVKGAEDDEDAYFLYRFAGSPEEFEALKNSEIYKRAVLMFKQFLDVGAPFAELNVDYGTSYRFSAGPREQAKKDNILLLQVFFDLVRLCGADVICHEEDGPSWYHKAVRKAGFTSQQAVGLMNIATLGKSRVNRTNDLGLVVDQAFKAFKEIR